MLHDANVLSHRSTVQLIDTNLLASSLITESSVTQSRNRVIAQPCDNRVRRSRGTVTVAQIYE